MTTAPSPSLSKRKPLWDPNQNHGRLGFKDYDGCTTVVIKHEKLSEGDDCPSCQDYHSVGKLFRLNDPGVIICLEGQPLINGTRYEIEKYRCNLCGEIFAAELPLEVAERDKYSPSCRSNLAIARYWLGLPFKRIEMWQAMQGIPVPDATQWDEVSGLYNVVKPIYHYLIKLSAESDLTYYDDTPNKILSKDLTSHRKGVYTTALVSQVGPQRIYLFYTSERYASENLKKVLSTRESSTDFISMCDASAQNIPDDMPEDLLARWVFCFCLVHGRRKFFEVLDFFNAECDFVLDIFSQVYQHERHGKEQRYSAQERLSYHQKHSGPLMASLKQWLNNKLLFHEVEENNGLGQAIKYLLKHWEGLTQFLRHAGAPLDNSLCEQAIKVAIRHRKNSLFYRTTRGAEVGDSMMSIIHTAARAGVNVFHYLTTLQIYAKQVQTEPERWLPWHYQATLQQIEAQTALPKAA